MGTLSVEMERNIARGDKEVNGFSGAVRSIEVLSLEKDDEFTVPETFKVYEQKIGTNTAQYIMVELTNGNAKPLYPSTFTKTRQVFDQDGLPTGVRVSSKGTACELFRKHGSVQEAMNALRGKTLKVTNLETVHTLRYGTTQMMEAQIPTIDIVEKAEKK